MLRRVTVRDFALIEHVELAFEPGLNVLTGETGAGKSILIDALSLVLGRRADAADVRRGAAAAYVEAVFDMPPGGAAAEVLADYGLDADESLLLSREVLGAGRSMARINGRAAPLRALASLGRALVDVHGPSEHQSLFRRARQLEYLDRFAGLVPQRRRVAALVRELRAAREAVADLVQSTRAAAREIDLLTFQVEEIEAAQLRPDEDAALRAERGMLANAEQLRALAAEAAARLDGETPEPMPDVFGSTRDAAAAMAALDPGAQELAQQAAELQERAGELALELRAYADRVDADPSRLRQIDERLDLIDGLVRKYGGSVDDVTAYAAQASERLAAMDRQDADLAARRGRAAALTAELAAQALELSDRRRPAAAALCGAVLTQLADLGMPAARFETRLQRRAAADGLPLPGAAEPTAFDESGVDQGEYRLSVNAGQPLRALADVASEGERSRILLGLKVVLAHVDATPTLVFDEIDVGVGSRAGEVVGRKLAALAAAHQVVCITHLPPVAAFADAHFLVSKADAGDGARTLFTRVRGRRALDEIAAMSGVSTAASRRVARDLLAAAAAWKRERQETGGEEP